MDPRVHAGPIGSESERIEHMTDICLVGAGVIARTHADAIANIAGLRVTTVVDPIPEAAQRLAQACGATRCFASVQEMVQAGGIARAHVLVPPNLHAPVTKPLLVAGISVLLEKPLAVSSTEAESLIEATGPGTWLGVNQNFVHHPAFVRLRDLLGKRALGRPLFASCLYSMPLRQLQSGAFGHWMFREPGNILLEQAVHPLSQLMALTGQIREVRAVAAPALDIAPGVSFCASTEISMQGERIPAQLHFAVGQSFPVWQLTVLCDDGVITADILANRCWCQTRGRWVEAVDTMLAGLRSGAALMRESIANMAAYAASQVRLRPRSDGFYLSMKGSITAFHAAVDAGHAPELDGRFGADLIALCEAVRDQAFPAAAKPQVPVAAAAAQSDITILGGTGFIGRHVVRRFLDAGLRITVMARSLANLPADYTDPRVTLMRGDIADPEAVRRAIGTSPLVVNLAHGGGGATREATRVAMVDGAENVARACLEAGVKRLVHVGSIAGLYLGPQSTPVTGATPPDPQADARADYAYAKALCDRMLMRMHAQEHLPVVIVRPGVVIGEGTPPFHSGVALFNNEQHWIGWNDGRNPLPFVLVADVADALYRATVTEGIDGRCYNLVGDVTMNAREYTALVAAALQRPLRYHPQSVTWLWLEDVAKWTVKRIGGRNPMLPSRRDFLSRGMVASFDCTDAKTDLGWTPEADRARFIAASITVHAV